ncbi:hypothetical protein N9L91_02695 [Pseudomonadales bacterium]|nr:hypothetical protein [Pseudomonadales bacterium]
MAFFKKLKNKKIDSSDALSEASSNKIRTNSKKAKMEPYLKEFKEISEKHIYEHPRVGLTNEEFLLVTQNQKNIISLYEEKIYEYEISDISEIKLEYDFSLLAKIIFEKIKESSIDSEHLFSYLEIFDYYFNQIRNIDDNDLKIFHDCFQYKAEIYAKNKQYVDSILNISQAIKLHSTNEDSDFLKIYYDKCRFTKTPLNKIKQKMKSDELECFLRDALHKEFEPINEYLSIFLSEIKTYKKNGEDEKIEEFAYDLIHKINLNYIPYVYGQYIPHEPFFELAKLYARNKDLKNEIEILQNYLNFPEYNLIYARHKEASTRLFKCAESLSRYENGGKITLSKKDRCNDWGIPFTIKKMIFKKSAPEKSYVNYLAENNIMAFHEGSATKFCLDACFMKMTDKYYIRNNFFSPEEFGFSVYFGGVKKERDVENTTLGLNLPLDYKREAITIIPSITREEFKSFIDKKLAYCKKMADEGHSQFDIEAEHQISWSDFERFCMAIYDDLGTDFFVKLARTFIKYPYAHVGWPDLELINEGKLEMVEIKVKDSFTDTQIYTLPKLNELLPGRISVINLVT